jgi:hypothetical protein
MGTGSASLFGFTRRPMDLGEGNRGTWLQLFKLLEPHAQVFSQGIDIDSTEIMRQRVEPTQCAQEQRCTADAVLALHVMERGCGLNEALQKRLLLPMQLEPDRLPVLVGEKEILVPIALQAFSKFAGAPIESHLVPIIDHFRSRCLKRVVRVDHPRANGGRAPG